MEPANPLDKADLPAVAVDTDAALDRTRTRGRRRRRQRAAGAAAGLVGVLVVVAIAVASRQDGDQAGLVDAGPNDTRPTETVPLDGDRAVWFADPDEPPQPDATSFVALVTRVGCHGGVTGDVLAPRVEVQPDFVKVTFVVAAAEPGSYECPGNDEVRYEVDVGEPIGDRLLRDGGCPADPRRGSDCIVDDGSVEGRRSDVRWPEGALVEPHACDAPEGSPLDVAGEPNTREYAEWTDVVDDDGCLVRIDYLAERSGPEHCGWDGARVMVTGDRFGALFTPATKGAHYVRDPEGLFGVPELAAGFEERFDPPEGAEPTGYSFEGRTIWIVPDDPSALWVFAADTTMERWPRGETPICN